VNVATGEVVQIPPEMAYPTARMETHWSLPFIYMPRPEEVEPEKPEPGWQRCLRNLLGLKHIEKTK
jgi:hypothetical protein